jgi:hypothetical protein
MVEALLVKSAEPEVKRPEKVRVRTRILYLALGIIVGAAVVALAQLA